MQTSAGLENFPASLSHWRKVRTRRRVEDTEGEMGWNVVHLSKLVHKDVIRRGAAPCRLADNDLKGNCVSGKHVLSFMYPVCSSLSPKEKRATANVRYDNSILIHGFMYTSPSSFPNWSTGPQVNFLSFFKSALIEGDTSICCVFLRLPPGHGHSSEVALLISRSRLLFLRRRSLGSSRISTPGPTVWAREARYFGQTCIRRGLIHDTEDSICSTTIG
jgi:hypothetical protein